MNKCPACGGEVWNNVEENNSRELNGEKLRPDYSCKDKACGFVSWREKGVKKEFKDKTPVKKVAPVEPKPGLDNRDLMMRLAYRKDLMVAVIETFKDTSDIETLVKTFDYLWKEVEK